MDHNLANGIDNDDRTIYQVQEKQFQKKLHGDPGIKFLASAYEIVMPVILCDNSAEISQIFPEIE